MTILSAEAGTRGGGGGGAAGCDEGEGDSGSAAAAAAVGKRGDRTAAATAAGAETGLRRPLTPPPPFVRDGEAGILRTGREGLELEDEEDEGTGGDPITMADGDDTDECAAAGVVTETGAGVATAGVSEGNDDDVVVAEEVQREDGAMGSSPHGPSQP